MMTDAKNSETDFLYPADTAHDVGSTEEVKTLLQEIENRQNPASRLLVELLAPIITEDDKAKSAWDRYSEQDHETRIARCARATILLGLSRSPNAERSNTTLQSLFGDWNQRSFSGNLSTSSQCSMLSPLWEQLLATLDYKLSEVKSVQIKQGMGAVMA